LFAGAAAAQVHTGVIAGVVVDGAGRPVADVEVTALKSAKTVRSDTAGAFTLPPVPSGNVDLSFRRLSFEPVVLSLQIAPDDTTDIEVTLTVVAQALKAVVVLADQQHLRILEAFETRRKQGIGHFITRGEIEKRHPLLLSDMVRMIPGAILASDMLGRTTLHFARVPHAGCPPQYFVDGMQVYGYNIDDMPATDVEGVELYAGPSGLPPEYNRLHSTVSCGAVIIWTRIPGNDKSKP
jgi:hypothetical protein